MNNPPTNTVDYPPSYFAKRGNPSCSRWGKSEIEWLARAYVQALANDGDTWKELTRAQVHSLINDEQRRYVHDMLTSNFEVYIGWFNMVRDQLADADGAFGVGGFWPRRPR